MTQIKAIETQYKGYRFRSRLEARWAVFFDAIGIKWEYEKEEFELSNGRRYLPDFYLEDWELWCEIKPGKKSMSTEDTFKIQDFVINKRETLLLIEGSPWVGEYGLTLYPPDSDQNGPWVTGEFCLCRDCNGISLLFGGEGYYYGEVPMGTHHGGHGDGWGIVESDQLLKAFQSARSVRFEYGETP